MRGPRGRNRGAELFGARPPKSTTAPSRSVRSRYPRRDVRVSRVSSFRCFTPRFAWRRALLLVVVRLRPHRLSLRLLGRRAASPSVRAVAERPLLSRARARRLTPWMRAPLRARGRGVADGSLRRVVHLQSTRAQAAARACMHACMHACMDGRSAMSQAGASSHSSCSPRDVCTLDAASTPNTTTRSQDTRRRR